MTKSSPLVSVCIPVYNPGVFLGHAITSVLEQLRDDLEVLVVDDCSSQPVEAIVAQFIDDRLRFFRNDRTLGLPGNWNRCIELARGQYVAIFHQDDVMRPSNLSRKVAMLNDHPQVGFVYSDIECIDEAGSVIGGHYIPQPNCDLIMPGSRLFEMVANTGDPIACPAVVVRSECYRRLGSFDPTLHFATDLEMWLRIAAHYQVGFIAAQLVAHRIHRSQEGARYRDTGRDYEEVLRALDLVFASDLPSECARFAVRSYRTLYRQSIAMARWELRQGKIEYGLRYASIALRSLSRICFGCARSVSTLVAD